MRWQDARVDAQHNQLKSKKPSCSKWPVNPNLSFCAKGVRRKQCIGCVRYLARSTLALLFQISAAPKLTSISVSTPTSYPGSLHTTTSSNNFSSVLPGARRFCLPKPTICHLVHICATTWSPTSPPHSRRATTRLEEEDRHTEKLQSEASLPCHRSIGFSSGARLSR